MIILDTNVISELMRPKPDLAVVRWVDRQPVSSLWTSAINVYEVQTGLHLMQPGKKRTALISLFDRWLAEVIQDRVVSFDMAAARNAAGLTASRKLKGRSGELRDTMIAGIVLASRATLATHDVKHFEDIASVVVDPWSE